MMMKTEYRKMNGILGAILLCLITSGQRHIIANEQQESIRLDWKKGTGSSFWEAEVNRFDVPSGAVVEVNVPKDGLMRVTGDQPTSIYGTITSSNPVYVINPHGVVVGPKGKINGIFGIPALDMQISSYTSKGHETDPVCYHSTSNSDLITFLTDEQREEIENSLYKTIKEYIWLGDIRIGGISKIKEVQVSPCCLEEFTQLENQKSGTHLTLDELIQAEIESVKIQRFITPYENLQGVDFLGGGIIRVEHETPDSTCKLYQWRECFPRKSQNLNPQ
jgi:filamentous hemagglutinin family protein